MWLLLSHRIKSSKTLVGGQRRKGEPTFEFSTALSHTFVPSYSSLQQHLLVHTLERRVKTCS